MCARVCACVRSVTTKPEGEVWEQVGWVVAKRPMTHLSAPCVGGEHLEQPLNSGRSGCQQQGEQARRAALSPASASHPLKHVLWSAFLVVGIQQ